MEMVKKYTRGIDREYQRLLLDKSTTSAWNGGDFEIKIDPFQVQVANDYLVSALFGKTQLEIDDLTQKEYAELLSLAEKEKNFL